MGIGWYYSDNLNLSDELVDQFADSKFGIDKWSSFAREIIQNSLDAQDDEEKPVEVIFDLNKEIGINDIPGGIRIKEILGKCKDVATNKQTKNSYAVGLEVLSREKIYCLKISDKNTKGVKTGRDEAWGAFVFDEGKSIKQRSDSAGSHGVGKKVPFIISSCNTVFYATKNKYLMDGVEKSDCLMQGKTTLIDWVDESGKRKNNKGWFGVINENADAKNKITPLNTADDFKEVNPYFIRKEEYGTDVIIIGVNIYNREEEVKAQIINAVLENFFVAILNNKLVVDVLGEKIEQKNFETIFKKYYREQNEAKKVKYGLEGCLKVYNGAPEKTEEIFDKDGKRIGSIDIYFGLGNENNKKNYTVVRNHGMRIRDYRLNKAGQPYTAVVYVDGKELNELLSSLENAAHDNFIDNDDNMEIDINAIYALNCIKEKVSNYICEQTSIDEREGQTIDGLSNIITMPGVISSVKKKKSEPTIKRNGVAVKGSGTKSKDYNQGRAGYGESDIKKKSKKGKSKPAKKGGDIDSILYDEFIIEPTFIKGKKEYLLKFSTEKELKNAEIKIKSINSDGKIDDTIYDYIESVYIGGTRRKFVNGKVSNVSLEEGKIHSITLKLNRDVTYQLTAEFFVKGDVQSE